MMVLHAFSLDDPARLAALRETALLDSPPEEPFDRLTRLAASLLHAPVALLTLVDDTHQFFKSAAGLPEPWASRRKTPLSLSFCKHVVSSGAPLVIDNAGERPALRENSAIQELGVTAYLGVPLRLEGGHVLGDLCVFDSRPREWLPEEVSLLETLCAVAEREIEQRVRFRRSRDPTERKLHERALREAEERYRMVVRATNSVVWDWDIPSGYILWNGHNQDLLRYREGEMGSRITWWYEHLHPEDRQQVISGLHAVLEGIGESWSQEHRFLRGDGSYMTVLNCCSVLRDQDGKATRVIGSMTDVTERKRQEEAQRFLARASALLDDSLDHQVTFATLARLAVPTLGDCCLVDLVTDGDVLRRVAVAHVDPARERKLRQQDRHPGEAGRRRPPGAHVVGSGRPILIPGGFSRAERLPEYQEWLRALGLGSLMAVPLVAHERILGAITLATDSGRCYGPADLLVAEDLAHRAALAIEHGQLFKEAQEAIHARDEILGVISHDLRNPLNAIQLTVSLLVDQAEDRRAENVQKLEIIQRATAQMTHMIQDLLDVSSLEAGRLTLHVADQDVASLVVEAASLLRPVAEQKSVRLECAASESLAPLRVDAHRILRVISNLVGNAIKFTPEGGAVTLRAERGGGEVRFTVADTGPGIPRDLLPNVFDRYWQGRQGDRRGVGLGLSIAKEIVTAHGGRIWAESRPGHGATFIFTVPAISPHA